MDLAEKLEILADSAKYDVACTSSGVGPPGTARQPGQLRGGGHLPCLYRRTGAACRLLKVLMTRMSAAMTAATA